MGHVADESAIGTFLKFKLEISRGYIKVDARLQLFCFSPPPPSPSTSPAMATGEAENFTLNHADFLIYYVVVLGVHDIVVASYQPAQDTVENFKTMLAWCQPLIVRRRSRSSVRLR